ncbi:hypothetical protein T06_11618 [Trichinella sp. T6]|nr:hypothetical protein T06_11618 [Trichinella sp. T6]
MSTLAGSTVLKCATFLCVYQSISAIRNIQIVAVRDAIFAVRLLQMFLWPFEFKTILPSSVSLDLLSSKRCSFALLPRSPGVDDSSNKKSGILFKNKNVNQTRFLDLCCSFSIRDTRKEKN